MTIEETLKPILCHVCGSYTCPTCGKTLNDEDLEYPECPHCGEKFEKEE